VLLNQITPTEWYKPVENPHSDTEEATAKEKMLTMELLLNKVSPENIGSQLPYSL